MDQFEELKREVKGLGKEKQKKKIEHTSFIVLNSGLAEMIYNPEKSETQFAVFEDDKIEFRKSITLPDEKIIKPFPPEQDVVRKGIVLFPSKAEEYGDEKQLLTELQNFIHRYLEISPLFEKIASYYVLFTWIYDNFNELPYLRAFGDWGTGKTRFIKTIGILCYKPIFCGGSVTSSPIFRILENIKGTFVIDEADFKNSECWADIIKILNCGYEKGLVVLRSEGRDTHFETKTFNVFSPKILATREQFEDQALESRCLTENMERMSRQDIPFNLPDSFWEEATQIRNKLLMWRFRNYGKKKIKPELADRSVEPRLNQIMIPLASIIEDKEVQSELKEFIKKYNQRLILDRGMKFEAEVLEVLAKLFEEKEPTMEDIAKEMNEKYGYNDLNFRGKKFTAKYIGGVVRRKLRLEPRKTMYGWAIPLSEKERIEKLKEKFGLKKEEEPEIDSKDL